MEKNINIEPIECPPAVQSELNNMMKTIRRELIRMNLAGYEVEFSDGSKLTIVLDRGDPINYVISLNDVEIDKEEQQ